MYLGHILSSQLVILNIKKKGRGYNVLIQIGNSAPQEWTLINLYNFMTKRIRSNVSNNYITKKFMESAYSLGILGDYKVRYIVSNIPVENREL